MTSPPIRPFKLGLQDLGSGGRGQGILVSPSLGGFWPILSSSLPPPQLEAQLLHLSSTQQEASWENLQLREAERDLAGQLEEVRGQLQVTRGHLDTARTRGRVSWQIEEEPRQVTTLSGPG